MTFITQPNKEGETKECPNCNEKIVARLKEYKDYPNKIQWQNEKETKAHYDKEGNCKGVDEEVNKTFTFDSTNTSGGSLTFSTDGISLSSDSFTVSTPAPLPEMDEITEEYVNKQLILIHQIEQKAYKFLGKDARGDKVGMYVKLILEGINRK